MEKIELNQFTVKEGDREMDVVIPLTGDTSYDRYLEEAEREKTADQLRKKPPRPVPADKKEVAGILKEIIAFRNRRQSEHPKRYF